MDNKYDVLVVGAGNGGLMAAALTAKAGLKTLLLEQHNIPGGSASSFKRGRFEFEPSLHELCSVGTVQKPNEIYKVFEKIGAKINWRYEYNTFRAICTGEDGFDVKLRARENDFIEDMEKAVPGCRDSVKAFFDLERKDQEAIDYIMRKKGKPNPLVMLFKYADFMRDASYSMEEVEKALGMPEKARNIINTYWAYLGVPTDELSAFHYLTMVESYVNDGAAMPYKRSHELSLAVEKAITDNGGEVWYNSEVTRFLYNEDGSCAGVELADGKKLYAKQIISNVIPNNVYAMSDNKNVPARELKLANSRKLGMTFVTVYIGLDCTKEELGVNDYTVFKMTTPNPRECFDNRGKGAYYVVNCLNEVIPDCTPEGTCTLFFTIPMFGNEIPENLKPENYQKWKNEVAKHFIKDYEKTLNIDIMSHIEEIEIATPVTFARYLNTPDGEIYGYELSGWDSIITRISAYSNDFTVKNLHYCGGHNVRGDGYSSAYITGESAANAVINILKGGN